MNLSNISQIRCNGSDIVLGKLNGEVIYRKVNKEKEYAIEYTITARDTSDTVGSYYEYESKQYPYYLFKIYDSEGIASYTGYTSIEITKTDGTTTSDLTTSVSEVQKIKVWYPETTTQLVGGGYNETYPSYITEILNSSNINTSNFVGLDFMFSYCTKLKSLDISSWDTSNVTTILAMCQYCSSLTSLNVSNLNTSSCTDLRNVFYYCTSLKSITGLDTWDTSNVTTTRSMFFNCYRLTSLDLSSWDTSNVTTTTTMFYYCTGLKSINLSGWDTSSMTTTDRMLCRVKFPIDWNYDGTNYANWTLGEINSCYFGLFPWKGDYTYIIYDVDTEDTTAALSKVYNTYYYYYLPRIYTSSYNFSKPTASNVIISLSSNYTLTNSLSTKSSNAEKILVYYPKKSLYQFRFEGYSSSTQTSKVVNVIDTNYSKTNMSFMFRYCAYLKSVNMPNVDTSKVTDMSDMFNTCTSLTSVDLSSFDTSKVTDMSYMFYGCSSLTSLDLSNFNTSKVTTMSYMFRSVPSTVDWHYDGTNYQNFTLTESQTDFSGTFPW